MGKTNLPKFHIVCRLAATPHGLHALIDSLIRVIKLLESNIECVTLITHRSIDAVLSSGNQFARVGDLKTHDVISFRYHVVIFAEIYHINMYESIE